MTKNNKNKVTVSDIANKAGVSPATVSRVIHHRDIVKEETRNIVEDAMASLGCEIQIKAANNITREQPVILLNVPEINNVFYTEVIRGATISANAHGYYLLITQYALGKSTLPQFCQLIKRVDASGVITLNQLSVDALQTIQNLVPIVQCCEFNPDSDFPYVTINDFGAAQYATEHLLSCGRNKIAFINGPHTYKYAKERQRGFLDALEKADLSIPRNWMIQLPEVNYEMAYAATCQLLNSDTIPNAFFVISDVFAAAVIRAAKRYQYNVPRDIMVVGFDNIALASMYSPSITSVNQPKFQEGYSASEMLVEQIANPDQAPKSILLDTELIIRESTSAVRRPV